MTPEERRAIISMLFVRGVVAFAQSADRQDHSSPPAVSPGNTPRSQHAGGTLLPPDGMRKSSGVSNEKATPGAPFSGPAPAMPELDVVDELILSRPEPTFAKRGD